MNKSAGSDHWCGRGKLLNLRAFLCTLVFFVACLSSPAQLNTIAYDGFNYSAGSLAGNNGGTGWTSAWGKDYGPGNNFNVTATGMSYSGLTTVGGSIVWGSGSGQISEASRTLTLQNSGVVYLRFLSQLESPSSGGTPTIRLLNSGSLTGGIGANGGTYGTKISILNTSLSAAADGSSSSSANLSALNLVITRIDYSAHSTSLWVNPNLALFNYASPPTPDASYPGLAPVFNTIALFARNPASLDEFTVASIPEPSPALLLMMGLGVIAYAWRRGYQFLK